MNPCEAGKKLYFSYCIDRDTVRDRLEYLYHCVLGADPGDVVTFSFSDLDVYIVIVDESEKDKED